MIESTPDITVLEEVTHNTLYQGESSFVPRVNDHLEIGGSAWRVQCVVISLPQPGALRPRVNVIVWCTRLDPSTHDTAEHPR